MSDLTHCPCGALRKPTCVLCKPCWDSAPVNETRDFKRLPRGKARWEVARRLKDHARSRRQQTLI